jgi:GNAT superfamily N-acetyltransferase
VYQPQKYAQDIEICTFNDLANDPEREWKLFLLVKELRQDVPLPEPRAPLSYEDYVCYTLHAPVMLPDGIFVALHHGMYIGLTELRATADKAILTTGLTAVKRTYRHQGIARQLKLRSITAATASGYRAIRTKNDTRNHSMLALNEQLGFVKRHLWLEFERQNEKSDISQAIYHL